ASFFAESLTFLKKPSDFEPQHSPWRPALLIPFATLSMGCLLRKEVADRRRIDVRPLFYKGKWHARSAGNRPAGRHRRERHGSCIFTHRYEVGSSPVGTAREVMLASLLTPFSAEAGIRSLGTGLGRRQEFRVWILPNATGPAWCWWWTATRRTD